MSPSPRLLLLEDELPLARIVRKSLTRQGYHVHHAANGVLGLAAFQRAAFDLCIVDVMLRSSTALPSWPRCGAPISRCPS